MAMMLGEAQGRITLDVSDVMANSKAAQGALTGLDATAGKTGGGFETLKNGMLGLGTALIAPMAMGLKGAVDLEQGIANINASLGGVDPSVLDDLSDMFLEVGSSSRYSATEVAAVSDELAKAGFTAEDMLGGMTASVIELSQATGDGLVPATEGMIQAFSMWDESIVGVELAITDAAHAADVLTNASNQSAGGIQDIIGGLRNAGPALAAVGLSFEEAAGAIALFTNYGYSGDEIGTKLTRTLTFLAKPTEEAAALMEQYGIAAFDAQGKFVGFPALFDMLQAGFEGVGEETRLAALKTIFGAEAFDLMNLAVETGGDPLREFTELMYESGTASEQSALRMNTLGAQFEELKEGVGAFLTSLVMGLVPGLRILVDTANTVIDVLSRIPDPIKTVIGAFAGLLAGIAAITRAMQAWQAINMFLGGSGAARAGLFGLGALGPIFIGLAAVIGIAAAAIKFNLFGIADAVNAFRVQWMHVIQTKNVVSTFLDSLAMGLRSFDIPLFTRIAGGLETVSDAIDDFVGYSREIWRTRTTLNKLLTDLPKPLQAFGQGLGILVDTSRDFLEYWQRDGIMGVLRAIPDEVGDLGAAFRMMTLGIQPFFQMLAVRFPRFADMFLTLRDAMRPLANTFFEIGLAMRALFQGDWQVMLDRMQDAGTSFLQFGGLLQDAVISGLSELGAIAGDLAVTLGNVVVDIAGWVMGQIPDIWAWLRDTALPAIGAGLVALGNIAVSVAGWVAGTIGDVWAWLRDTALPAVGDGLVALGEVAVSIAGFLPQLAAGAVDIYERIKLWIYERLGGGGGGEAGSVISAVRQTTGIPIGAVAVLIGDWVVNSTVDLYERIKQWVMGTGAGVSGSGSRTSAALSRTAGSGIPIGPVAIQITEWDIVADAVDMYTAIDQWIRDSIEITDAEAARWEPTGQEIGRNIMRAILRGIGSIFGGGGGAGGVGGAGGGTGVSTGAIISGTAFADSLWAILRPVLEGAWGELQPQLEAWGEDIKNQFKSWWNGFMPSIFEFDLTNLASTGGGAAAGGLSALTGGGGGILGAFQSFLDGIMADLDALGAKIETAISEWWADLWDVDLSIPDFDVTGFLPDIGFSIEDIPGYDKAVAALEAMHLLLTNPMGFYDKHIAGGGDGEGGGAAGSTGGSGNWITDLADDIIQQTQTAVSGIDAAARALEESISRIAGLVAGNRMWQIIHNMIGGGTGGGWELDEFSSGITAAFQRVGSAVTAGMDSVSNTIRAKSTEWGTAMGNAINALNSGGAAGLGAAVGGGAAGLLSGLAASVSAGMDAVTTTITTKSMEWGMAMGTAIANLNAGSAFGGAAAPGGVAAGGMAAGGALSGLQMSISTAMDGVTATITTKGAEWIPPMQAAGVAAGTAAGAGLGQGLQTGTTAVTTHANAWPVIVESVSGSMQGAGSTSGAAASAGVADGMQIGTTAVTTHAGAWPEIVASFEGAMRDAGSAIGAAAGEGVAAGLESMLDRVSAAASAIVAEVERAMAAGLRVQSPSKVTQYIGQMVGMGLVGGMLSTLSQVSSASAGLASAAVPSPYMPNTSASYGYGGTTVSAPVRVNAQIHTQGNLTDADKQALAREFAESLRDGIDIVYTSHGATS